MSGKKLLKMPKEKKLVNKIDFLKWETGSKDHKFLEQLFRDGKIPPGVKPHVVRKKYFERFSQYSPDVFRFHFNKVRGQTGGMSKK